MFSSVVRYMLVFHFIYLDAKHSTEIQNMLFNAQESSRILRYLGGSPRESHLKRILGANPLPATQSQDHQGQAGEGKDEGKDGDKCKVVITKLASTSSDNTASCSFTPEVSRKTIWSQGTWNSLGGREKESRLFVGSFLSLPVVKLHPMGHFILPKPASYVSQLLQGNQVSCRDLGLPLKPKPLQVHLVTLGHQSCGGYHHGRCNEALPKSGLHSGELGQMAVLGDDVTEKAAGVLR